MEMKSVRLVVRLKVSKNWGIFCASKAHISTKAGKDVLEVKAYDFILNDWKASEEWQVDGVIAMLSVPGWVGSLGNT
jgi:hypothetical protein